MQVSEPAILTKPGPNAAHELADAPLSGSSLPGFAAVSDFGNAGCSASAVRAGNVAAMIASRNFRIPSFIARGAVTLADELDADGFAAAPDHLAGASGSGIARKRQPQFGRQRVAIVDRDLRAGGGHVL